MIITRSNIWTFDISRTTAIAPLLDSIGSPLFDSLGSLLFDTSGDIQDPDYTFEITRTEFASSVTRLDLDAILEDSLSSLLVDTVGSQLITADLGNFEFDITRLNPWTFVITQGETETEPTGDWILDTGYWDDNGVWDDNAQWID